MREHDENSGRALEERLYVAEVTIAAQRALCAYMIEKSSKIAKPEAKKKVILFLFY